MQAVTSPYRRIPLYAAVTQIINCRLNSEELPITPDSDELVKWLDVSKESKLKRQPVGSNPTIHSRVLTVIGRLFVSEFGYHRPFLAETFVFGRISSLYEGSMSSALMILMVCQSFLSC